MSKSEPTTYVQFQATPQAVAATIEVLSDRVLELEASLGEIHDELVADGHFGDDDCPLCKFVRQLEALGIE